MKEGKHISDARQCPACGRRMAYTHSRPRGEGSLIERRRLCACGHLDTIYIREQVVAIVEVSRRARRVRINTAAPACTAPSGDNSAEDQTNVHKARPDQAI